MMNLNSLCGKKEYRNTNINAGKTRVRRGGDIKIPRGTRNMLNDRALGRAEWKYHRNGDVYVKLRKLNLF